MYKYYFYKTLRFFHLISKKKFKKKIPSGYKIIAKSKYFDAKWYLKQNPDVKAAKIDPVIHYLNNWEKFQPSEIFDGKTYCDMYGDVKISRVNPLFHYEKFGKKEGRILSFQKRPQKLSVIDNLLFKTYTEARKLHFLSDRYYDKLTKKYKYADYRAIYKSPLFDKRYYCKMYSSDRFDDAVEHYLNTGFRKGYNPSEKFDNDFYLNNNPDILEADLNPLYHWETAGKSECRRIAKLSNVCTIYPAVIPGSVLLITHELSLTGAPIALLNMAKVLMKNGINPVILSPKDGELKEELDKFQIEYVVEPYLYIKLYRNNRELQNFLSSFPIILFNTIDTLKYARFIKTDNKKVCWVHEGKFGYNCAEDAFDLAEAFSNIDEVYSVGKYSKTFTDRYVPAEKSKILLYGIPNLEKQPCLSEPNKKLIFGIFGVCCERKGTDIFIEALKKLPEHLKNKCCFKIIGKVDNNNFCNNLKKLAADEPVIFTGQLSHDATINEMSKVDVVVCPSLDDPMPIVCTEAMLLYKPVICSDKTGTAAFINDGVNGYVFHLEQKNLAKLITVTIKNSAFLSDIGKKWHEIYLQNFTEEIFERNIMSIFSTALKPHKNVEMFNILIRRLDLI